MEHRTFEQRSRWERAQLGLELRRLVLSCGEIRMLIPGPLGPLAGWCRISS